MSGTVLVTGAAGFVGSWLIRALQETAVRVVGTCLPGTRNDKLDVEWEELDLRERSALDAMLARVRPRWIVHLAALAQPAAAALRPLDALSANYLVVDALLEAMRARAPHARLLLVSSGEVYGFQAAGAPPHDESRPLRPDSLYAATRAAAEQRAVLAVERDGLDVVRARPFNHTGPGRGAAYAESSFARQLARIERGEQEPRVRVGNLDARRDFSDVRDVVCAYRLLLERGERGAVYNVASGRARSIRSLLERLIGCSRVRPAIEVDPALYRAAAPDQIELAGDASRLRALGWAPARDLDQTLAEVLRDWRGRA
jgi:GDP-4-dehydro-6-deoxy-D-mannose reductase